jgi:outer membrane lipoprotein SlyB
MVRRLHFVTYSLVALSFVSLSSCGPDYSPNTYSGDAMQQANKVEPGIVVGFRQVAISADGTVGAVTGGAAGGILGAQYDANHLTSELGALGGGVVGGVVGTTIQHVVGKTTGWEYIVREPKGDLLSVTQEEPTPIPIGQKVLVITGKQARIVPDYSVELSPPPATSPDKDKTAQKPIPPAASPPTSAASQPGVTPASETTTPSATPGPILPAIATTSATPVASAATASTMRGADPADGPPAPQSEPEKTAPPASITPDPPAPSGDNGNAPAPNAPPP